MLYADQMNLYAYVHNDPLNMTDPTGMQTCCDDGQFSEQVEWMRRNREALEAQNDRIADAQGRIVEAISYVPNVFGALAAGVSAALDDGPQNNATSHGIGGDGSPIIPASRAGIVRTVALGLGETLDDFARSVGGSTYESWQGSRGFWRAFDETVLNSDAAIHFNLDGMQARGGVGAALTRAAGGSGSITDQELFRIIQHPDALSRTTFYRNGAIIDIAEEIPRSLR